MHVKNNLILHSTYLRNFASIKIKKFKYKALKSENVYVTIKDF